jgi:transposase-like protein
MRQRIADELNVTEKEWAAMKLLYLALRNAAKKWTMPVKTGAQR